MRGNIATFADLIAPVLPAHFFASRWENEPLHIARADPRFYEELLTRRDVEAVLSSGGLRFPAVQLARGGAFFPPEAFTRSIRAGDDVFAGVPNLERIAAEYRAGATISLPAFHRAWKPLGALAASIEGEFDHAVHTNVYITPGNATGFAPHYDTHEVFVLQIAGTKHWRIGAPLLELPHRSQPFQPQRHQQTDVVLEIDLNPGDLLYLPRGFVHTTSTPDGFSLHVTLGMTVYTWVELLAEFAQSGKSDPGCRRALPPGFAGRAELKRQLKETLIQMIAELQHGTDYDRLLENFLLRVRQAHPASPAWAGGFHCDVTAKGPCG